MTRYHKIKVGKKGQIHLTETVAVLFIFFVLVIFSIIFYSKYQQVSFKEKSEELVASRAMDTTLRILFLPELICSRGDAEAEDNCIDLMKLRYANETMQDHAQDYYFDMLSYATITITQLSPEEKTFVLYDKPKPNYKKREPTYFVVSLRDNTMGDSTLGSYGFGYVKVEVYS